MPKKGKRTFVNQVSDNIKGPLTYLVGEEFKVEKILTGGDGGKDLKYRTPTGC